MGISAVVVCCYLWTNLLFDALFMLLIGVMKYLKRILFSIVFLSSVMVVTPTDAQCPMCRLSAENNLKDGGTAAKGLNSAILFLLATPYLLVGTLGYIYWKGKQKDKALDQE